MKKTKGDRTAFLNCHMMLLLKQMLKQVPGARSVSRLVRHRREMSKLRRKSAEQIFTEICRNGKWSKGDSVSGTGSDLAQTSAVRDELPSIFRDFEVSSLLDIPCGDFYWMKHVNLAGIDYTGADIVADLIQQNRRHETGSVHFCQVNLVEDELPKADLVFCRDCLVHLSFKDALAALHNVCGSGARYLLTTTFPHCERNRDIATGQWRMINLEVSPFFLPPPLRLIDEKCSEGVAYQDKSLGLWAVADIGAALRSDGI
jgi:SAM-dependent methyltransferase